MKKFNFAKIVSLVFVCAMLLCALAVTALAQDETTVEIVSNNVYFGEKYQLMYAVNAPAGAKVSATVNGEAVDVVLFKTNPTDEQNNVVADYAYILAEGVAAQAIDTVVTFTVEADGKTATSNYSVLQYVYERMYVKNIAEGKELAMFEAFLAFADAANANFTEGETVSFNDYKYVTVVNGTLDGNNTAGMFLPGATPFENIEATLDYDNTVYNVEWNVSVDGAEAVRYNSEAIKTVTVDGNMTVTRVLVESAHTHTWDEGVVETPATCTETGVLVKTCTYPGCGETTEEEIPVIAHNFVDGKCSVCGESDPAYKGYSGRYYIATKRSSGNYFYMTNDLGTATTKRYQAVDSGLTALPESINNPESNKIFVIEMNEDGTTYSIYAEGISEVNKYLGWTSGNSGALVEKANAKAFTITPGEDNTYNIYFDDRYLSLNGTSGNNYFAFYTGTQKQDLVLIPILECEHTNTQACEAVAPTCTEAGKKAGTICTDCGTYIEGGEVVEALDHDWKDADCTNPKTCRRENCGLTEGEPVGHTWGDWTEKQAPTCKDAGSQTRGCTKCDATEDGVLPATGEHNDGNSDGFCDVCNADMNSDEAKAKQVLAGITGPADVTEAGTVELDTAHDTGYKAQVNWAITGGTNTVSNVSGNVLTVVLGSSETTLELTVTVTVGDATVTEKYTINVAAGVKEPVKLATYELGTDGDASHSDGSTATTYTDTVNGYTLDVTNGTKFYTGARDAKGNSAFKLGTSSAAGSFSFTVGDDVNMVVIYVAGYKAKTATVTINDVETALTTLSDNGEYTAIEIDTTTNKTVSFAVTSGNRCMVNTIEFWG